MVRSKSSAPWLRYLATAVLAVLFLVMSFLGGMVQRIVGEVIPSDTGGIVVVTGVIVIIGVTGWLIWRGRQPRAKS